MTKKTFLTLLTFAVLIRLYLTRLPSFEVDMNAWLAWAMRMKDLGPGKFYSDSVWTQYTPLYLYWLWFIGKLGLVNELAIKIPTIAADLATALIIKKVISKYNLKLGAIAFFLYFLNPVVIFNGSVWGQIDGILTLLMLCSVYLFLGHKLGYSGVFAALAFLLKPQAFVLLPAVAFIGVVNKYKTKQFFHFVFYWFLVVLLLSLPFFPNDPVFGIYRLVGKMTAYYSYTSVFAYNFWTVIGMWQSDAATFLGLSYYLWGILLYLAALLLIFLRFKKSLKSIKGAYVVIALSLLAAFLFPTRVHERYLFPAFAFLLISAFLYRSRIFLGAFIVLTVLNFLNLYYPYAYYSQNFLKNEDLMNFVADIATGIGVVSIGIFYAILFREEIGNYKKFKIPKNLKSYFRPKDLLILLLAFAFITRFFALSNPRHEYFDEVYHAFTARVMLHGDPKAWEWWNTPPEGFAYEWTHPPVAKLGMVLGMAILGENSFGWRFLGALLGVISVYLVYLIAKTVFNDEKIGLLSAGVFALDGLALVVSRIGMNDIYFLTFALAALYFFLKDRNFLSGLAAGLSVASKWSAIWLMPIYIVAFVVFKKKLKRDYLWLIILPPVIYLASYLPFFLQGHTFSQFINLGFIDCLGRENCTYTYGLQQQMLWYHTHLKATHAYTSPWWSWPLLVRPVYLYTSEVVGNMVERIYLIGNPFVFWGGIGAIMTSIYLIFKTRNRKLAFIAFSYFVFFVPWAVSPRIMFLYHYLPSIPFMAIAIGYVLKKYPVLILPAFAVFFVSFVYFFPHWTGLDVPLWLDKSYYWFPSWR